MTVPDAIEVAKNHLISVLPDYAKADPQLEELETPPFGSIWSFTFSATLPASVGNYAADLAEVLRARRVSKSVRIDAEMVSEFYLIQTFFSFFLIGTFDVVPHMGHDAACSN